MMRVNFKILRDCLVCLYSIEDRCGSLFLFNPRTKKFESATVEGWIELYSEILSEAQRKSIYKAVCRHCRPRGVYRNLMRFAKNFADEVVREIEPTDLGYEIGSFYTKDHCPVTVEFEF